MSGGLTHNHESITVSLKLISLSLFLSLSLPLSLSLSSPAGHTDLLLEGSLGKCRRLISRCLEGSDEGRVGGDEGRVGGDKGAKLLAYSTILDTVMSKVRLSSQMPWGTILYDTVLVI